MSASLATPARPAPRVRFPARLAALFCLALLVAAGGGCSHRPSSVNVPLKFRPTSQLKLGAFAGEIPDTTVYVAAVTDNRPDKEHVGENLEESTPVPVVATDEPAPFLQERLNDLLSKAGLKTVPDRGAADRVLQTELHSFWTKETNTYESEIRATFVLQDRTGRQLWKGTINGTAERFGRSLSPENYQEVFSDGVVDLVQNLLSNAKFREALGRNPGA